MPLTGNESSIRYRKLIPIPRSTLGRPKGYKFKFETRDVACKRISDQTNRVSAAFNREAVIKMMYQLDRISKESHISLGKMQVGIDKTKTSLIDMKSYRIFLHEKARESESPALPNPHAHPSQRIQDSDSLSLQDGHSPDKFGRYGDVCWDNSQPAVKATKMLYFDGTTKRRMEAHRLVGRRDAMACLPSTADNAKLFSMAENLVLKDRRPGEEVTDYHRISDIISKLRIHGGNST